ncbi:MAG: hypothetical protein ACR2H3_15035, partial [Acidimicrobiales bacterium]
AVPAHLQGESRPIPVRGLPRREVGLARRRRGLPSAPARAMLEVVCLVVAEGEPHPGIHPDRA